MSKWPRFSRRGKADTAPHAVSADHRRLSVSRGHHRSLLPEGSGLGARRSSRCRAVDPGSSSSVGQASAATGTGLPQRSRHRIRSQGVSRSAWEGQDAPEHEPKGKLLGQRRVREFLFDAGIRRTRPVDLAPPIGRRAGVVHLLSRATTTKKGCMRAMATRPRTRPRPTCAMVRWPLKQSVHGIGASPSCSPLSRTTTTKKGCMRAMATRPRTR